VRERHGRGNARAAHATRPHPLAQIGLGADRPIDADDVRAVAGDQALEVGGDRRGLRRARVGTQRQSRGQQPLTLRPCAEVFGDASVDAVRCDTSARSAAQPFKRQNAVVNRRRVRNGLPIRCLRHAAGIFSADWLNDSSASAYPVQYRECAAGQRCGPTSNAPHSHAFRHVEPRIRAERVALIGDSVRRECDLAHPAAVTPREWTYRYEGDVAFMTHADVGVLAERRSSHPTTAASPDIRSTVFADTSDRR